jgi:hypothetical protein
MVGLEQVEGSLLVVFAHDQILTDARTARDGLRCADLIQP